MRETLTYGTVCSGIGCAELAASQFGWQPVFCSEIEDFPSEVMAVRHPGFCFVSTAT